MTQTTWASESEVIPTRPGGGKYFSTASSLCQVTTRRRCFPSLRHVTRGSVSVMETRLSYMSEDFGTAASPIAATNLASSHRAVSPPALVGRWVQAAIPRQRLKHRMATPREFHAWGFTSGVIHRNSICLQGTVELFPRVKFENCVDPPSATVQHPERRPAVRASPPDSSRGGWPRRGSHAVATVNGRAG